MLRLPQVSAGGSLANTLVGLSRLGAARSAPKRLRVAMAGCTGGSDALGSFARAQLQQAGVEVLNTGSPVSSSTGTVIVLQTPDAQRSFLSSFPADDALVLTEGLTAAVKQAKLLVLEGYMWELPGSDTVLPALVSLARKVGTLVALTAGDAGVVERHASKVLAALGAGVDVFFCNAAEAEALLKHIPAGSHTSAHQQQQDATASSSPAAAAAAAAAAAEGYQEEALTATLSPAQQAALQLAGICPTVVVTDGSKGSYVTAMGELVIVPPFWSQRAPVDTTGAGDGYAAGFLYAYLAGADLHSIGHFASRTASAVISRYAPQLTHDDADEVVASHKLASWRLWLQQQAARAMLWQQASPVAAAPAATAAAAAAVAPATGAQQLPVVQPQQPAEQLAPQPEQQDAVKAFL
jgi:sugar/nucleoside kinase (ribokinase family)